MFATPNESHLRPPLSTIIIITMNNPRRFTPGISRPSAPTTPRSSSKVLPTPPTTVTPAFRILDDSANHNSGSANTISRPHAGSAASGQPGSRLPIEGFVKSKRPQTGLEAHGTNSPARPSRIPIQSTVDTARPQRIFGQPNGLLPSISPPPPPPAILTRSIQQNVPTRFSSPFSPPEDQNNPVNRGMGQEGELDSHGPHTSTSGPLDGATAYQRVLQTHSSAHQVNIIRQNTPLPDFQEDFEESDTESPSPSKRRIGRDYGHQAPKKRMRSALNHSHGQNLDDGRYLSQEQPLSTAPQASQASLPHGYYSTSLEAYIEAHQSEWIAAQKRWETCTMEEWQNAPKVDCGTGEGDGYGQNIHGASGIFCGCTLDTNTFKRKRMKVYAGINTDVQAHKVRLDGRDAQLTKEKGRLIKQAGGLAGGFIPS
ncbi:hypothetical protein RHS04_04666 [Rhizoctonia solani]|uniref:Uncharacterized protein n=1 Tax=Rhizoctonia solani TaxID=456999 RepID=A0A8H7LJZ7_9AGAM|nr:hypothetical protein RHS04_04666 [Rhizoctonia solani]